VLEVVGVYLTKVSSSFDFIADAYKKEFSVFFANFILELENKRKKYKKMVDGNSILY
jgi:hypothetical protein